MRIAYLTGEYPRATDTFIQREVEALRKDGAEVHTFSVRRTADEHIVGSEQRRERDATRYILPVRPLELLRAHLGLLAGSPARYLRAVRLAWATRQAGFRGHLFQLFYFAEAGILASEIRARGIEHLHNHFADSSCTVSMLAAELGGFPFSFTMHGPAIFFDPRRWRIDEKIARASFVACISHFCRSQGMIFADPAHWSRMHIVHCGIDPALFEPVRHAEGTCRLLYVGRLAAIKGLPLLVEAVAEMRADHPDVELSVVGDGPDRAAIEARARRLGLEAAIRFEGYRSQTWVREALARTDVFVLPSFAEGVPVVLMEAMAAGVPVVATRVAGVAELVEDGVSGFLVPPGDPVALRERVARLLGDAELRARFGAAGRQAVTREFDVGREGRWLHRLIRAHHEGRAEPLRPDQV